jgi:hypothetical protein
MDWLCCACLGISAQLAVNCDKYWINQQRLIREVSVSSAIKSCTDEGLSGEAMIPVI